MKHYKIVKKYNNQGNIQINAYKRNMLFFWQKINCLKESVFQGEIYNYISTFSSIEEAEKRIEKEKELDKIRNKVLKVKYL